MARRWGAMRGRQAKGSGLGHIMALVALVLLASGCSGFDLPTAEQSVFRVFVLKKVGRDHLYLGTGSGFLVGGNKVVATSEHVVRAGDLYLIGYVRGDRSNRSKLDVHLVPARLLTSDPRRDLALLEATEPLLGKPVQLAGYRPSEGRKVIMISFPGAADSRAYETQDGFKGAILQDMLIPSNTEGAISRILESAPWDPNVKVIQHQAASSPGSSGAPVFDECGIVAAIHNASSSSPGVRFAIRSIELIELMRRSGQLPAVREGPCNPAAALSVAYTIAGGAVLAALAAVVFAIWRPQLAQKGAAALRHTLTSRGMPAMPVGDQMPVPTDPAQRAPPKGGGTRHGVAGLRLVPLKAGAAIEIGATQASLGVSIGRQSGNDVVIDHETVSKQHARLRLGTDGRLQVEDLGSGNGTWLGNKRIRQAHAQNGAVIAFGQAAYHIEMLPAGGEAGRPAAGSWLLSGVGQDGSAIQFVIEPRIDPLSGQPVETVWTLGRADGACDHVLSDRSVSGRHARLRVRPGGGLDIQDLGSSNGSFIDGRRISQGWTDLSGTDQIRLGSLHLTLSRR